MPFSFVLQPSHFLYKLWFVQRGVKDEAWTPGSLLPGSNPESCQLQRRDISVNMPIEGMSTVETYHVCSLACTGWRLERGCSAVSVISFDWGHTTNVRCLHHRAVSCLPFDTSPWTAWTSWVHASLFDCLHALCSCVRFPKSTEILKATAAVYLIVTPPHICWNSMHSDKCRRPCLSMCVCETAIAAEQISSCPIRDV